jgi:hypothetical protein
MINCVFSSASDPKLMARNCLNSLGESTLAFGDIGREGYRRSPDLVYEPKLLRSRKIVRYLINLLYKIN